MWKIGCLIFLTSGCMTTGKPVVFQSEESKTIEGEPVFNEVSFTQQDHYDIWMMRQSHHGIKADASQWDRIAIIVDKQANPKTAEYWELEPGPLEWHPNDPKIPLKAVCYACHTNGPRAIRPDPTWNLTWSEKAQLIKWNKKITNYGRIQLKATPEQLKGNKQGPPVQYQSAKRNQKLDIETCNKCHNEKEERARQPLLTQNAATIEFMTKKHYMPPAPFRISDEDQQKLRDFLAQSQ